MTTVSGYRGKSAVGATLIVSPETSTIVPSVKERFELQITNVSFKTLLFRLLTTNPQLYLVAPRKGVLGPNSSVCVTVSLNREESRKMSRAVGSQDEFRVEYCVMQPGDVIEPRDANVPDLIKARKKNDRSQVQMKNFCCRIGAPPAKTVVGNKAGGTWSPVAASTMSREMFSVLESPARSDAVVRSASKLTPRQLEASTLAEKNRRQIVEQQKSSRNRVLMAAVSALVLALALWYGLVW